MKNYKKNIFLIFVFIPVFLAAWGFEGHKTVANIAWNELNPDVQKAAMELLSFSGDSSFIEVAVWADNIKRLDKFRYANTFHYVNIPAAGESYAKDRDCPDGTCLTYVIPGYIETLSDKSASDSLRNEALKFLIHFVGDVHQPMHTGLPEDRGGNDVHLNYHSRNVNLHGLWDYEMLNDNITDYLAYADRLHKVDESFPMQATLAVTDPVEWTNESFQIGRNFAYSVSQGDTVNSDYEKKALQYIETRITQAGYRLAFLLNNILP